MENGGLIVRKRQKQLDGEELMYKIIGVDVYKGVKMLIPHPLFGDRLESIPVLPWEDKVALMQTSAINQKIGTLQNYVNVEVMLVKNRLEEWPKQMPVVQLIGSMGMLRDVIMDNMVNGDDSTRQAFCDLYSQLLKELSLLEAYQLERSLDSVLGAFVNEALNNDSDNIVSSEINKSFDIVLQGFGDNKIAAIKAVREINNMGLKEAKELVESSPVAVIKGISENEAMKIATHLREAGALVEIREQESYLREYKGVKLETR